MEGSEFHSAEERAKDLGLDLSAPLAIPPGVEARLAMVRVIGSRCMISGHGPQKADGSVDKRGQLGVDLTVNEGVHAAHMTAVAMLGTLRNELGSLDKIKQWIKVFGMVNSAPGFDQQVAVINGFSNLIVEVFGPERGLAARSAVGMAALPFNIPVEIDAEVELY